MNLPNDVSRCAGNGSPVCTDCARRLADSSGIRWWIEPVADGEGCEMKPIPHELTDAGRGLLGGGG